MGRRLTSRVSKVNGSIGQSKPSLTTATCGAILESTSCGGVKRLRAISVLFLLGAAVCVFALPQVDLAETAFNEADAPLNLATPIWPRIRIDPPLVDPIAVLPTLPLHCTVPVVRGSVLDSSAVPRQRSQHSLQDLLCTFLI